MVQDLKKINIFKDLSSDQLASIKKICRKKKYGAGKVIFEENMVSPGLYIVLAGTVKVVKKLEDTKVDETLTLIKAGGFFGELSFVDGRAHSATIIAVRDTELL